jgi:hypothetical protein
MVFLNKELLHKEAKRLGIDASKYDYRTLQGLVTKAKKEDGSFKASNKIKSFATEPIATDAPCQNGDTDGDKIPDPLAQYENKEVLIAPEMAPTKTQLIKYNEELGDEVIVEEKHFEVGHVQKNLETGTYHIKEKTGNKTVAQSTLPKQNAAILFSPGKDIVPRVRFNKREGYLWTHHRLPNIKVLLQESGYYEKFKDRFVDEPAIWYSAGKLLTCDIGLVHSIFQEIEEDVKRRNR